ncbi:hypothetical protein [Roseivivax sp. CAU 1753]
MSSNPFDPAEMMKTFDPEAMRKMFDPQHMMAELQKTVSGFDATRLMEQNRKQLEEMAEANKAAAETYRDLMAKQMAIFQDVIAPAQKMLADPANKDNMKAQTDAINKAMVDGFALMKTMAENTRKTNEQALATFKAQLDEAMKDIKKT